MQKYLEQYKQTIRSAISLYEENFSVERPISHERAHQVQQLKTIVNEAFSPKMIRDGWKQIRATIKTGWVIGPFEIYGTGNSQFRDSVDRIIFSSHYRDDIFTLYAEIGRLKEELEKKNQSQGTSDARTITHTRRITSCSECKTKDETIDCLQRELKHKQSTKESFVLGSFVSDADELDNLMSASLQKHGMFQ